jgi:hypothetical protein
MVTTSETSRLSSSAWLLSGAMPVSTPSVVETNGQALVDLLKEAEGARRSAGLDLEKLPRCECIDWRRSN